METIFRKNVVTHLEATLQDFRCCTANINLSNIPDKVIWKWSATGRFSIGECYKFLNNGGIWSSNTGKI